MRPSVVAGWCSLVLLAAAEHAAACTCWRLVPFVWPSGLKEVPRLTHVLVIPGDWTESVELVDLGPAVGNDELGQRLVLPGQAPAENDFLRAPVPDRPRVIDVEHRPMGNARFAEALVPRQALPAKHRILVISTNTVSGASAHPERRRVRSLAGVFETGELLTGADVAPVPFVVRRRLSPDPYADGAACESSSGSAVLAPSVADLAADLFGVWDEESTSRAPTAHALLRHGELELGHTNVCEFQSFGINLQSGGHRFKIRPWRFSEFGRPVSVAFEL